MTTSEKSQLSTRLSQEYLDSLKERLPIDWAEKVKGLTGLSLSKIRMVLRSPDNYDEGVIDKTIEVADEYQRDKIAKVQEQKDKINSLAVSI